MYVGDSHRQPRRQTYKQEVPRNTWLENPKTPASLQCSVHGALAFTLHLSRWCGLAPIRIVKRRKGFQIKECANMKVYGYLLLFVLNAVIFTALILDMVVLPKQSVCGHLQMTCVASLMYKLSTASIVTIGIITATKRMKQTISFINDIDMIIYKLINSKPRQTSEKSKCLLISLHLLGLMVLGVANTQYSFMVFKKDLLISCLFGFIYTERSIVMLLELHYSLTALYACKGLNIINEVFKDLIQRMECKTLQTRKQQESLRRLVHSHNAMCDVVRRIDEFYGSMLMVVVFCLFLYVVVAAYLGITFIVRGTIGLQLILIEFSLCLSYTLNIMLIVEPGYRTQKEMDRTLSLSGRMLSLEGASGCAGMRGELRLRARQLCAGRAAYAPMGVCVLTRSLVVTIFGTCSTYLIIALQFQPESL